MDLLADLNPRQKEAVAYGDGPLLILAGAGSGKTRILTRRIAYLIREKGVKPWQILAITFTNKAANEMKERVESLLGEEAADLWVSTFHSACVRILRREIEVLGFDRNFAIFDPADQLVVMKEVLAELNLNEKYYPPRAMLAEISNVKNELVEPGSLLAFLARKQRQRFSEPHARRLAEIYGLYQQKLRKNNALDFDDLLMTTVQLFQYQPHILEKYQDRFRYLLVDEYQDTNHAQYRLVSMLAARHRNLCVVGDDDQSIYKWRGADIRNIRDFEKDYPDATVIKLEQNYRSTQIILDAANAVVQNNMDRKEKTLWTENNQGEPIIVYTGDNEHAEAWFITKEIKRLLNEGYDYHSFAVLYRTNAQSRVLEEMMMREGIPYQVFGGLKFYERKEIKDLLAYLRVIANPADTVSLRRIINVPKRGVGPGTLEKVEELAAFRGISLYQALHDSLAAGIFTKKVQSSLAAFVDLIETLRQESAEMGVTYLVDRVLNESGYLAELLAENTVEAQSRIENLQEFRSVAKEYDNTEPEGNLTDFLLSMALVTSEEQGEEKGNAVTLMTLHSAKGLEFSVVFIAGMEEGVFPHSRAQTSDEELEEERRLCYVGITRAKERLYLTGAQVRTMFGNTTYQSPSRFLDEIPPHLTAAPDRLYSASEVRPRPAINRRAVSSFDPDEDVLSAPVRVGDCFRHAKWGDGYVQEVSGEGENTEIVIDFPRVGTKKLLLKYAPLKKIN